MKSRNMPKYAGNVQHAFKDTEKYKRKQGTSKTIKTHTYSNIEITQTQIFKQGSSMKSQLELNQN